MKHHLHKTQSAKMATLPSNPAMIDSCRRSVQLSRSRRFVQFEPTCGLTQSLPQRFSYYNPDLRISLKEILSLS